MLRYYLRKLSTFLFLGICLFLISINISFSQNENCADKVHIYIFWGDGCPHCAKEKKFLGELKNKYNNLVVKDFEVWNNKDNGKLLQKVAKRLNVNISGVPFTIIEDKTISGYMSDVTTGKEIEDQIIYCSKNKCEDNIGGLLECDDCNSSQNTGPVEIKKPESNIQGDKKIGIEKLTIPFWGEIEIKDFSLPIITIIIGTLDGFNPCAMWILLFLISMLLGMGNRKKMWILGSAFILSSATAYFFFITAWLQIILFFGILLWIKLGIGFFAIVGGGYNIKEYFKTNDSGCSVVGDEKRNKMFEKIRNIIHEKSFLLALVGICILAFVVNIVELLCSAGLPVIFTQILAINKLNPLEYYLYILLYIFFFMIDDLFIFVVSMLTLEVVGVTTKYTKYSHLIGGVIMLIVGILLIFKPDILMFG